MKKNISRKNSVMIISLVYFLAGLIGYFIYSVIDLDWWIGLLISNIIATVVVFAFSVMFDNASVYDPYWSIAPLVMSGFFAISLGTGGAGAFALISVTVWSLRLTSNWNKSFRGLGKSEDWRYVMLKRKTGKLYPIVNLLGIHLVPTLLVYAGTLPVVFLIRNGFALNFFSSLFILLSFCSILIENIADNQMREFKHSSDGVFPSRGLWKYCRHPNYLGEISYWWFLGFAAVASFPKMFYLLAGAIGITVLFFLISIPMMESRISGKPGYAEYKKRTRMILPIKK